MSHPFSEVWEEVYRLEDGIKRLAVDADRPLSLEDMERDPLYELPRRLRAAIEDLDRKAIKNVRLDELQRWYSTFDSINWQDPQMVRRVAKVYLLEQVPFQVWEVRYRSASPGRPLVLLMEIADFPGPEMLAEWDEMLGFREEYQIAAKKPSWRVAWKSSWYGL